MWWCADDHDKQGARKKIKRKEVKLGKMMGLGDVDEEAKKAFGQGADKADEMQYSIFRLRQLKRELAEHREQVFKEVPTHPPPYRISLMLLWFLVRDALCRNFCHQQKQT